MSTTSHSLPLRASKPAQSRVAFVTLVTNADFALGARALLHSLARTGSVADRVVMHTRGVTQDDLAPLAAMGARLIETDLLATSQAFNSAHARETLHGRAPFTRGNKPAFHTPLDNFVKLRMWQLEYEACVFLDADTLVLRNIDQLFEYPGFCAAPNVYESLADFGRMNSGVFVAQPDRSEFNRMLAALDSPGAFWRRTDQTFLQHHFEDWHRLTVYDNMLQYVWLNLPELWEWSRIRVLHFQYEKPWQRDHPKSQELAPLIALWNAFSKGENPNLHALPDAA